MTFVLSSNGSKLIFAFPALRWSKLSLIANLEGAPTKRQNAPARRLSAFRSASTASPGESFDSGRISCIGEKTLDNCTPENYNAGNMTRHTAILLLPLVACLIVPAAANDMVLDARTGSLQVSGSLISSNQVLAAYPANSSTGLQEPATAASLWVMDDNNQTTSLRCTLQIGSTVHLQSGGQDYLTIVFNGQNLTVTALSAQSKFTSIVPPVDPGYTSFLLNLPNGASPGTDFTVTGYVAGACNSPSGSFATNPSSGLQQYLRIYPGSSPPPVKGMQVHLDGGGSDGPPAPISGYSLKIYAPYNHNFSQPCGVNNAILPHIVGVLRFERQRNGRLEPWDPYMYLDGIGSWRITAYPERLKSAPSGDKLLFSVPAPFGTECGSDSGGNFLNVLNGNHPELPIATPQQFVLDWPAGLFSWFTRRSVPASMRRMYTAPDYQKEIGICSHEPEGTKPIGTDRRKRI